MSERKVLAAKHSTLEFRSRVLKAVRAFFEEASFLEVQTPVLTPAPAPEAHIDAIPAGDGWFLTTSPELYMKRLLAAGFDKIFQMTPVFRSGERGRLHHPEFTLLEWYRCNSDYEVLQQDCRNLLESVCKTMGLINGWIYQGVRLQVEGEWQHFTVQEAFSNYAGWQPGPNADQTRFDMDLVEKVEPNLGFPRPCILADYPANQASLARIKPGNPAVAERFELYWAGIELANGFSELTDTTEQRKRFEDVLTNRAEGNRTLYPMPEAFLSSTLYMPPCAGIALGIDRLTMLLAGADSLDQVVAFSPDLQVP